MSLAGSSPLRLRLLAASAVSLALGSAVAASGQAPVVRQAPSAPTDAGVADAQQWMHRALILRGAFAGGELRFDAQGRIIGAPKVTDWTLAGMDVEKVTRRPDGGLELQGTRVAIRYNPDAHEFQRHPQKDETLRVLVAGAADATSVEAALTAIFSIGMDPGFEHDAPAFWQHYFLPATPWPKDELTGQPIAGADGHPPPGLTAPALEKKLEPSFPAEALHDHVKGTVVVRFAVDAEGVPHRIVIQQPLGYGLDQRVAETVERLRFKPATLNGRPVAAWLTLRQEFE
jgi:TonB family protein